MSPQNPLPCPLPSDGRGEPVTYPIASGVRAESSTSRIHRAGQRYRHCKVFLFLLLIFLPSCVTFKPEPINPETNATVLEKRSLDDAGLRNFLEANLNQRFAQWPIKTWDFTALSGAAFYFHPSLSVVRAQWLSASAGEQVAAGRPNPTVSAVPGYNFSATSPTPPWIPALTFDIPIETAGKRTHRKTRAAHLSEAARWNMIGAAWQVRSTLRTAVIDLAAAKQHEQLLQRIAVAYDQILRSLEQRVQAGANARSDLAPMQIARAKSQVDLADARRQTSDATDRLAEAIGIRVKAITEIDVVYDLAKDIPDASALITSEARGRALKSRAEIRALLAEYAAAQAALQLEIAKQYPDVHLGPGYQYDGGEHKFTLGMTLELPILNQNQGPIAEARAHCAEVAARFTALQSKIIAEMDHAASSYEVSQKNLKTLAEFVAAQRAQRESISAQINAGAADPMDLLNLQLEIGQSEVAQFDAKVKAHQAYAVLEDATLPVADSVYPVAGNENELSKGTPR